MCSSAIDVKHNDIIIIIESMKLNILFDILFTLLLYSLFSSPFRLISYLVLFLKCSNATSSIISDVTIKLAPSSKSPANSYATLFAA